MVKRYILLSLVTHERLEKETYGKSLLRLLYDEYPSLAPQFANFYEPINKLVPTVEKALEYWNNDEFLCRSKSPINMLGMIGPDRSSITCITFRYDWNEHVDWFQILQKLVVITKSYFAYVHVFTENEIEGGGAGSAIDLFLNGVTGSRLKKGIPNLGWGHYFGNEYVNELDIPLIKKHGFSIESLGEGYIINVTGSLSDVITNYDYFNERRKLLKSLFRPGLFQNYVKYEHES